MYEKNLNVIEKKSAENENENMKFRLYLKSMEDNVVDKIVQKVYSEISKEIDCRQCANCCKKMETEVTGKDIENISKYLSMGKNEFVKKYLDNEQTIRLNSNKECIFLKDNSCTIYDAAPKECKSFPHVHKNNFTSRMLNMITLYEFCPIVYNVIEEMKKELNFFDTASMPREILMGFEILDRQYKEYLEENKK